MSKHTKLHRHLVTLGAFLLALLLTVSGVPASMAAGPAAVDLGNGTSFAILASSYITTGAPSTYLGNLGAGEAITTGANNVIKGSLYSGAAITTGAKNSISGNLYVSTATTLGAGSTVTGSAYTGSDQQYLAATTLYASAMSSMNAALADINRRVATPISGTLDGLTLTPGVYSSAASLGLTGVLTLDAQNVSNAVFIIKSDSFLVTAASSAVVLINGAQAKNVFWAPTGYFTAGADSILKGNVLAKTYVSIGARSAIEGRLFSSTGYINFGVGTADSVFGITGIGTSDIGATSGADSAAPTPTPTPTPGSAPTATVAAKPVGDALIGSFVRNAITFSGTPSPDTTYSWQSSPNGTSGWTTISGATGSKFRLTDDQIGDYVRSVVTAKNDSGTVMQPSPATERILPPAPARPVLASASDSGSSSFDGVTSVSRPSLSMAGLVLGSEVIVTATKGNLQETCKLTARAPFGSCVFPKPLADGTWVLSGTNVLSDVPSDSSVSLVITIDTTAPAVGAFTADQDSLGSSALTHSLNFDEVVTGLSASDFTLVSKTVTCDSPTLSGFGMRYTVSSANCRGDGAVQMRLKSGAALDLAGNSGPNYEFMTRNATRPAMTSSTAPAPTTGAEDTTPAPTTGAEDTADTGSSEGNGSGYSSTQATTNATNATEDIKITSEAVGPSATESLSQESELEGTQSADGTDDSSGQGSGSGVWNWWLIIGLVIGTIFGGAVIFLMRRRIFLMRRRRG